MTKTAAFGLLLLLMLSGCEAAQRQVIGIDDVEARVEIADTEELRRRGLMYRETLGENQGLLMVFPKPRQVSLWMLNTLIPLDVGFFDQQRVLLAVEQMQPDGGKQLYHSPPGTRYALEMNRGWFARHQLVPGARLRLDY